MKYLWLFKLVVFVLLICTSCRTVTYTGKVISSTWSMDIKMETRDRIGLPSILDISSYFPYSMQTLNTDSMVYSGTIWFNTDIKQKVKFTVYNIVGNIPYQFEWIATYSKSDCEYTYYKYK